MTIRKLQNSKRSYLTVFLIGAVVGCLTRLLDFCSYESFWGFASVQTLLGFWLITNTMIVMLSTSALCAGLSSFLYMVGMNFAFYGLQAVLGMCIPLFWGGFRFFLFLLFTLLAIPCALGAYLLYFWNRDHIFNSVLYALPVGMLAAEAAAVAVVFYTGQILLFQLLMDAAGGVAFGVLFFRRAKSKVLFLTAALSGALLFYTVIYHRELSVFIGSW